MKKLRFFPIFNGFFFILNLLYIVRSNARFRSRSHSRIINSNRMSSSFFASNSRIGSNMNQLNNKVNNLYSIKRMVFLNYYYHSQPSLVLNKSVDDFPDQNYLSNQYKNLTISQIHTKKSSISVFFLKINVYNYYF